MLIRELTFAAIGTGFTCLATVLGAAMVFFFREDLKPATQKIFLGFAAGVMVAASVWSLLIPSMEMAEEMGQSPALPVGGGFLLGGAFLMVLDRLTPHLHIGSSDPEGLPAHLSRTTMIVLAVTLHNIPEGMAVGLSFALAAQHSGGGLSAAMALAIGIGLQNFPEGAAISLPLRQEGVSTGRSFLYGALSGLVEPVFGILVVLAAGAIALAGSTIAVNAATGNRLLRHFTVIIGGKEYQAEEIEGKENVYQMENGATITFSPGPASSGEDASGEEENFEVEMELDNETDEASVSVSEPASGVSAEDTSNAK